jgi:hypothetical protein
LAAQNKRWWPISAAPFDRDLELAARDGGELHVLIFPCRRILGGWLRAATKERICVNPTLWRRWLDPTSSVPYPLLGRFGENLIFWTIGTAVNFSIRAGLLGLFEALPVGSR